MIHRTNFVIVFLARSGSTWVSSLLSSHPDVIVDSEILSGTINSAKQIERTAKSFADNADFPAAGIQVKLTDIVDLDMFDRYLLESNVKLIFLERNNVVKKAVSFLNAVRLNEKVGKWNLYSEKDRLGDLEIDPEVFRKRLEITDARRMWARKAVEKMKTAHLKLTYEDLLKDTAGALNPVFDFLGVDVCDLKSPVLKNTPDNLAMILKNYDDLRAGYAGTEYENMFD